MKILAIPLILFSITGNAQDIPGTYPLASAKVLSLTDIQDFDEPTLKLMRNEIFARYGYIFKNPELKSHFASQAWYKPSSADVTSQLTEIEKKNTDLIRRQEERIRTTAEFESFYALFTEAMVKDQMEKIVSLAHIDLMGGSEDFVREGFKPHWSKIKAAVRNEGIPDGSGGGASLVYETRMGGSQAEFIQFQKIGACWYITGFGSAG